MATNKHLDINKNFSFQLFLFEFYPRKKMFFFLRGEKVFSAEKMFFFPPRRKYLLLGENVSTADKTFFYVEKTLFPQRKHF